MQEKYIHRTIEKTIKKISAEFPVLMITGPRQVGKTTLLQMGKETRRYKLCFTRFFKRKNISSRRSRNVFINTRSPINYR